jgi:hypothetical protein
MHDTRAIDKVNTFGKSDVLPDLGFSWDWGNTAASFFHQGVDN